VTVCAQLLYMIFVSNACMPILTHYNPNMQILERPEDRHYYFNSCRTPWRLAVYYS
jgi:hypothetical protein